MRANLFIFTFLIYVNGYCQYFEKVFSVASANPLEVCFKSIELKNGDVIAVGTNDGCLFCTTTNYVTRLDSMGNTLWLKTFNPGTSPLPLDFVVDQDSNIVFITGVDGFDTSGNTLITVIIYRLSLLDGSVINSNMFDLAYNQSMSPSIKLFEKDSTYALFTGYHRVKINYNLDTISVRTYRTGLTKAIEIDNNQYLIPIHFNYLSQDTSAIEIFNSDLDSISLKSISYQSYRFFQPPSWNSMHFVKGNNRFYFTAYNTDSLVFGCVDTLFNEIWTKVFAMSTYPITISDLIGDDSTLYVVGENDHTASPSGKGYLLGLNAVGDTSLFVTYKAFGYYDWNRLYHVERTSHSGFLLTGSTCQPISVPKSSYILKTDSTGNTPITLGIKKVNLSQYSKWFIYPSISDGYFQFNSNLREKCKLNIYNSFGETIYSAIPIEGESINLYKQTPGIYFAELLSNDNRFFQKIIIQ